MSDTYHYEEGAIHNDHKKVLQIGKIGASDIGKLLGAFFSSDIEDAVIEGNDGREFPDFRQAIVDELSALVEKGDWVDGIKADDIKGMLTAVLGRGETPLSDEEAEMSEELNYEAPKINLQQLLKQPWFAEVRSEEKYDAAWTDAFVDALMGSEYGEGIAREWNNGGRLDRCTQIKGYLLGLLKDASVLKGSYDAIAEKANLMDNPRSFSRYMANGKKQPYAQWVKGYVKGEGI